MKKDWQTKKLGDVCDFEGGSQPPKSEFIYDEKPGYVRFLQIRDFGSDKNITYIRHSKKNRLCDEKDILIGRYGASVGKILTGKAGAYNVALMKTIPNLEVLDQSWFHHFLVSDEFQTPLLNVADRSAQAGFSKDDIYNFPVPVPPLDEQHRIVAILDEAFDGIATAKANAEKNLQNARALFESHLQSVFTERGEGWSETTLGSVALINSGAGFPLKYQGKVNDGIPFYKVSDMNLSGNERVMTNENNSITDAVRVELGATLFPSGSVIFPKIGGAIATNKKRLTGRPCCVDNNVMGAIPRSEKITSDYLYYFFRSYNLSDFANDAHLPSIRKSTLEEWKISVPAKLADQETIVHKLDELGDEVERLESIFQQKLTALDDLKKSLLHQAFSGQL